MYVCMYVRTYMYLRTYVSTTVIVGNKIMAPIFVVSTEIAVNSGTLDRRVYKGGKASLKRECSIVL